MDVWGDHNRKGLVSQLAYLDFNTQTLRVHSAFANVMSTYGVSHVLSPFPQQESSLAQIGHDQNAFVYRIDGAARVRFVRAARAIKTDQEAVTRLLDAGFDPDGEILLHDAPGSVASRRR